MTGDLPSGGGATKVLIVRLWTEGEVRARILQVVDPESEPQSLAVAEGAEAICATVCRCLFGNGSAAGG